MKLIFGDTNKFGKDWRTVDMRGGDYRMVLWKTEEKLQMPFKNNSIKAIYTSHLIEHLPNSSCVWLFTEFYRILKPGSVARIVAPDWEYYIKFPMSRYKDVASCVKSNHLDKRLLERHNLIATYFCCYSDKPNDAPLFDKAEVEEKLKGNREEFVQWCASRYDEKRKGGHMNGYNANKVIHYLKKAGFSKVYKSYFRGSKVEELRDPKFDLDKRKEGSFYVEAVK